MILLIVHYILRSMESGRQTSRKIWMRLAHVQCFHLRQLQIVTMIIDQSILYSYVDF